MLASETSQLSVVSRIIRSWMGGWACRIALVTSSLTSNSVVKVISSSPHEATWRAALARTSATIDGSAGRSQETT